MTRNTKIILGVAAGLIVLACLCVGTVGAGLALFTVRNTGVSVSPARVEEAAVRVGGFVPEGWHADYTARIGDFEVIGYRPESGNGHIIFAYFGPNSHADTDKLARDIQNVTSGRYQWMGDDMRVVERRKVLLGDQGAEVVISEGTGSSGAWRQALVGYQSERGFTIAILGLPAAQWTEGKLDEFISALH